MLEDALVMIGLYVLKDNQLITSANQYLKERNKNFFELYNDVKSEDLLKLYYQARKIESSHKIVLSVFQGSSILQHLPVLRYYQNDIEVFKSIYTKEYSHWSSKFDQIGELDEF